MRDGWIETTLGELCEIYQPETISKAQMDDTAPYIVYGANGPVGHYSRFNHEEPEVVVTCRGATCGVVNMTPPNCWITGNAMVVKPRDNRLIKGFLFWALQTSVDVQATISGSAQPQITRTGLAPSKIQVPPLVEQKRIVDVVTSVDAYIDALQQQADTARTARNAVLHELLSAGGHDWTETTLGLLVSLKTGKLDVNAGVEDGEFPFFTCSRDTYKIDVAAYSGKSVIVAGNGDLNVKYYEGEFNAYQRTYILQAIDESLLNPTFLFHFMDKYLETLRNDTQGSTIQYLKKAQFTEAPIILPPLTEQKRIVDVVSSMDGVIQSTEKAVVDAKKLRSGLLSDLLSGEHGIPASYDSLLGAA